MWQRGEPQRVLPPAGLALGRTAELLAGTLVALVPHRLWRRGRPRLLNIEAASGYLFALCILRHGGGGGGRGAEQVQLGGRPDPAVHRRRPRGRDGSVGGTCPMGRPRRGAGRGRGRAVVLEGPS